MFRLHDATSRQLRRRSAILRAVAIVILAAGMILFIGECTSLFFGVQLSAALLPLTIVGFGVPASLAWLRSRDYALWAGEEAEREHQAQ